MSAWSSHVTGMSAIPETPTVSVCDRTPQVGEAILAALSLTDCAAVTNAELQTFYGTLDLRERRLTSLQSGDFSGLSRLSHLYLADNALTELPEDIFAGLSSLTWLKLENNMLTSLPAGLFRDLRSLQELELHRNPLTVASLPPGIFVGLSSLEYLGTFAADGTGLFVFPTSIEETARSGNEIRLQVVVPHGAPGTLRIVLTTARAEVSEPVVTIQAGETHSEEFVLMPRGRGWQLVAVWDYRSRYPESFLQDPTGFSMATAVLDNPGGTRSFADRPDDISGPQIHVVYATRAAGEDRELDRNGSIEGSFEIIQEWLESEIGRTLRLDTYNGELDVTHLQVDDADIPSDGGELRGDRYLGHISSLLPKSPSKTYAVLFDIHEAGNLGGLGSEELGTGVTFLAGQTPASSARGGPASSNRRVGAVEQTMLHEIIHALGGVGDCAPNSIARIEELHAGCGNITGHVDDDPYDLMGVEVIIEEGSIRYFSGTTLDADRDDYVGHGRPGCFDLLTSPFLE